MKKKNGFTLIELVGVVAIIAVILVFAVPSLVGMLKRDTETEYNRFLKDLYLATESYIQSNLDEYPTLTTEGGSEMITLQVLIQNGYVKDTLVNPKTERVVMTTDQIIITRKSDGSYKYEYIAS